MGQLVVDAGANDAAFFDKRGVAVDRAVITGVAVQHAGKPGNLGCDLIFWKAGIGQVRNLVRDTRLKGDCGFGDVTPATR